MKIQDVMTRDVATAGVGDSVVAAMRLMKNRNIGCVVITNGGFVRGIVTDRDLLLRGFTADKWFEEPGLSAYMTSPVITVRPDTDVLEAVHLMRVNSVKRLPVEQAGKLVGIVSWGDLAHALDEPLHDLVASRSKARQMVSIG